MSGRGRVSYSRVRRPGIARRGLDAFSGVSPISAFRFCRWNRIYGCASSELYNGNFKHAGVRRVFLLHSCFCVQWYTIGTQCTHREQREREKEKERERLSSASRVSLFMLANVSNEAEINFSGLRFSHRKLDATKPRFKHSSVQLSTIFFVEK